MALDDIRIVIIESAHQIRKTEPGGQPGARLFIVNWSVRSRNVARDFHLELRLHPYNSTDRQFPLQFRGMTGVSISPRILIRRLRV